MRRIVLTLTVLVGIAGIVPEAHAIRLGGKASADRGSAAPLRERDMRAIVAGTSTDEAWNAAAERFPDKCTSPQILSSDSCDDDLRCAFLGARIVAARAVQARDAKGLRDAANFADRVADRLAAGGTCDLEGDEMDRWVTDRRAAAIDAARLHVALLEGRPMPVIPVVDATVHGRVAEVVRKGQESTAQELVKLRGELRESWRRLDWLDRNPAIRETRTLLAKAWGPVGSLPKSCGIELMDPTLLEDQWRGYLVREVVPRAMRCMQSTLPRLLAERGAPAQDADGAVALASGLESEAAGDIGGRTFVRDASVLSRLDRLAAALSPGRRVATTRGSPPVRESRETKVVPAPKVNAPAAENTAARPPTRTAAPPTKSRQVMETPVSPSSSTLVALAQRADALLESLDATSSLAREASSARTPSERGRVLEHALVFVHRHLCSPLEDSEPDDLDSAREALAAVAIPDRSSACVRAEGRDGLEELIGSAESLLKLRVAATLRRAARLTALGRPADARRVLDPIPSAARGTSWAVVYAWAARQQGDHVAAGRALASADSSLVDRLRSSGNEEVARLAAQAWLSPTL